jgi:ubiquitin-like 1-activating enzyme E1 A
LGLLSRWIASEREKSNVKTELKRESRTRSITAVREKKEGGKTVEFVTKEEAYTPLSAVITSRIDETWRPRRRKMVSAVLPAVKGSSRS